MDEYLNKGIKEVISEFREVADILEEFGIGCAPCSVGTCLLKDIVEIHNLPPEEETRLMARIAKAIYPDRAAEIPQIKRAPRTPQSIQYSPPMKRLVDEHVLIKRWMALIPEVVANLDIDSQEGQQLILDGVDFVRSYADGYHHAKEEDILFKCFDESLDIIRAIRQDHESARSHVRAILEGLDRKDKGAIAEHLNAYRGLLIEHIKKEDEILYPWMDRNLSTAQVGKLFSDFDDVERRFGDAPRDKERLIDSLEERVSRPKEVAK
ncbi:MAG: hemerythrin domain-containing protein [Dehalococcoidia bacterium]